jgi:HD-like signal output (HDOD) protein
MSDGPQRILAALAGLRASLQGVRGAHRISGSRSRVPGGLATRSGHLNSLTSPEEFRAAFDTATRTNRPLDEVEREQLGFTHCDSGLLLAEQWKLPKDIVEAIAFYHEKETLGARAPLVSLIRVGDQLCRMRSLGYGYVE